MGREDEVAGAPAPSSDSDRAHSTASAEQCNGFMQWLLPLRNDDLCGDISPKMLFLKVQE